MFFNDAAIAIIAPSPPIIISFKMCVLKISTYINAEVYIEGILKINLRHSMLKSIKDFFRCDVT